MKFEFLRPAQKASRTSLCSPALGYALHPLLPSSCADNCRWGQALCLGHSGHCTHVWWINSWQLAAHTCLFWWRQLTWGTSQRPGLKRSPYGMLGIKVFIAMRSWRGSVQGSDLRGGLLRGECYVHPSPVSLTSHVSVWWALRATSPTMRVRSRLWKRFLVGSFPLSSILDTFSSVFYGAHKFWVTSKATQVKINQEDCVLHSTSLRVLRQEKSKLGGLYLSKSFVWGAPLNSQGFSLSYIFQSKINIGTNKQKPPLWGTSSSKLYVLCWSLSTDRMFANVRVGHSYMYLNKKCQGKFYYHHQRTQEKTFF